MQRTVQKCIGTVLETMLIGLLASIGLAAETAADHPLNRQQDAKLRQLNEQVTDASAEGNFEKAVKVAREIAALRKRWQGELHWETVEAHWQEKRWQTLARLPEKDQKEIASSFWMRAKGASLDAEQKYQEAEPYYRKALAVCRKILGEEHFETASSYQSLASNLSAQGRHSKAQCLYEKVLRILLKVKGERYRDTALAYHNLTTNLRAQSKYAEAQPLCEKALATCRQVLGEEHPDTILSYNNVAVNLAILGKYAEAQPLYEKVLALKLKKFGEEHLSTALSYNNLAGNLTEQGKYAKAQPFFEKALAINRKLQGDDHLDTAHGYHNLAANLQTQGKNAEAQPLCEKALTIWRKVRGESHPDTARGYDGMANNFTAQGKYAKAQPLYQKALAIRRKILGEEHPNTAQSYNNLAFILDELGKHSEAQRLYEKSLAIHRKVWGEEHPSTATGYHNLAGNLEEQGKIAEAHPFYVKALSIRRKVLGEDHPDTASSYNDLAANLWNQDEVAAAIRLLQQSLPGQEVARYHSAATGFERAVAVGDKLSPRALLAVGLARLGRPADAFVHAEASLSRGLLDDLIASRTDEHRALLEQRDRLDRQLFPLYGKSSSLPDQKIQRERLVQQRREVSAKLSRWVARISAQQLLPLSAIQKQLAADAAYVLWLDVVLLDEHYACIVRATGDPIWVRLPGNDKDGGWTDQDEELVDRVYRLLCQPNSRNAERQRLTAALTKQRFELLRPHLGARGPLPPVRHLLAVPTAWAARVPLDVLDTGYRVSYVPSGSVYARLKQKHRAVKGASLLALGDPVFNTPAGSQSQRPPQAVPGRREKETSPVSGSPSPESLPGTRWEVQALTRLIPGSTALLGSDASEQRLHELARTGKLREYRLLHLATHGIIHEERPQWSALLLSRDQLPDPREQVRQGKPVFTGDLRVETIRKWRLDADLVTLSACKTALGADGQGDGLLGFAQALLQSGARSVLLSRWPADDTATALLMLRFYENLLGKREGLKKPLPRAEALAEARQWLRGLRYTEVVPLAAALRAGKLSGTRGKVVELPVREGEVALPKGERPYAHPFYWAAFVLVGDPD